MDESLWFGSLYNIIGAFAIIGAVFTQIFKMDAQDIVLFPFVAFGFSMASGGLLMVFALVLLALVAYFLATRFGFNDFVLLAIFLYFLIILS